jgi:ABC-type antimicrobial peptide transport system permease subunit
MILVDAMRLVVFGIVLGLPLAYGAGRLLGSQLHGIGALDPASIAVAVAVLAGSAIVAALLPALRAARVTPLVALREE